MSGIEIAGLVLGILPLLTEAVQVVRSLKQRYKSSRFSSKESSTIETNLDKIRKGLMGLQRQYAGLRLSVPLENASIIEQEFSEVANALRDMLERFKPVLTRDKFSVLRDLKAILRDKKATCSDIITKLDQASERLSRINQILVSAHTSQRVTEMRDEIIDKLESLAISSINRPISEDTYTPSFYVPSIPPIARECLDYDAINREQIPVTCEGKLKAELLRLVKEREINQGGVPVLGAVGMRGTGKTCALRGLGAQIDIREQFCDGIFFLALSESSSEEDVKQALCSTVYQTGGRNLSQEMKLLMGENAINDIIGRVSNWFKKKRCLFLVDNLCDTPSTGSTLLLRLSAILESCDITSGLVYTTTNEIDPFDAIVRFGLLSWESEACSNVLMKAAGFTREEINAADKEYALMTILRHCQGLKIALAIAGRNIKLISKRYREDKAEAWESYACALRDSPQKLLTEKYEDYESLYSQFSLSLRSVSLLENSLHLRIPYTIEETFQALSIADPNNGLRDSTLRRLWNLDSIHQAREVSKLFADANLVEITCHHVQGVHYEEISIHGLVLEYASHLADQNYADRAWIRGSEVWALRLLESYLGAEGSLGSNIATFTEWWDEIVVRRKCLHEYQILSTITRFVASTRTQSGQSLSEHCSHLLLFYYIRRRCCPVEVVPLLTLDEATVNAMHGTASTIAQERDVVLSEQTYRLMIFACWFVSKLDTLLHSGGGISRTIVPWLVHMEVFADIEITNSGSGKSQDDCAFMKFMVPSDPWMYIKHIVEVCWTLYDNSIGRNGPIEEFSHPTLISMLEETILIDLGVQCESINFGGPISRLLDQVDDVDLSEERLVRWNGKESNRSFVIKACPAVQETEDDDTKVVIVMASKDGFGKDERIELSKRYDMRRLFLELYLQSNLFC